MNDINIAQAIQEVADRIPAPSPLIRGLTIRQPWAYAITTGHKTIENRGWTTNYRGWIAIHAGATAGTRDEWEYAADRVADLAHIPVRDVQEGMRTRSAIVAVARLTSICSDSLHLPYGAPYLDCFCGPWAVVGQRHLQLTDVLALREPVPCKGALGLWHLPPDVLTAVREQWQAGVESSPVESSGVA